MLKNNTVILYLEDYDNLREENRQYYETIYGLIEEVKEGQVEVNSLREKLLKVVNDVFETTLNKVIVGEYARTTIKEDGIFRNLGWNEEMRLPIELVVEHLNMTEKEIEDWVQRKILKHEEYLEKEGNE